MKVSIMGVEPFIVEGKEGEDKKEFAVVTMVARVPKKELENLLQFSKEWEVELFANKK